MVLLQAFLDPFAIVAAARFNFAIRVLVLTELWQKFTARSLRGVEVICVWLMLRDLLLGGPPFFLLPSADDDLLEVASLGISPRSQVIGRGLPDVRVHGVQILEILDMYKIIWQMALGFVARNLGGLLKDKVVLVVEPSEAFVVRSIDGLGPLIFLLVSRNLMILALSDQFLIALGVKSGWISCVVLFLRDLEAFEGFLKLLEVELRLPSRRALDLLQPLPSLVGTDQGRSHCRSGELLLFAWIRERLGRIRNAYGLFLPPLGGWLLILCVFLRHGGVASRSHNPAAAPKQFINLIDG